MITVECVGGPADGEIYGVHQDAWILHVADKPPRPVVTLSLGECALHQPFIIHAYDIYHRDGFAYWRPQ